MVRHSALRPTIYALAMRRGLPNGTAGAFFTRMLRSASEGEEMQTTDHGRVVRLGTMLAAMLVATACSGASTRAAAPPGSPTAASASATTTTETPTASASGTAAPSGGSSTAGAPTSGVTPLWTASDGPSGVRFPGAQWVTFPGPGGSKMFASVFRPANASGATPVPVLLHGTEGLRMTHELRLAQDIATRSNGKLTTVAACWFAGGYDASPPHIEAPVPFAYPDGVNCPDAPAFVPDATGAAMQASVGAIVAMARTLPGVDPRRVGIFGHSRGSNAASAFGLHNQGLVGVVLAAGYPIPSTPPTARPPLLILQGTADQQTPVAAARQAEAGFARGGFSVEAHYYEGADHDLYYVSATRPDVVARIAAFFARVAP